MKLGMFMMPLHPPGRQPWQTYAEDREAILLADRLGYCEAPDERRRQHRTQQCVRTAAKRNQNAKRIAIHQLASELASTGECALGRPKQRDR